MDDRVLAAVLSAVTEINQQLSPDERLDLSPDAVVFGAEGKPGSLMLVSLIVATEQEIMEKLSLTISLYITHARAERCLNRAKGSTRDNNSLMLGLPHQPVRRLHL
ncbi:MAG: hypothetical protein A3F70_03670 [Acidobacteria bacterium RIFCSPLOWO2_12_FULL_67_14]|nr:MAG: hypothetical protein A3F70_03670 [Acidobacteria bacterium RIFCSPLOWO2_12_FULL_67_14]